jgi:hypothetical protein
MGNKDKKNTNLLLYLLYLVLIILSILIAGFLIVRYFFGFNNITSLINLNRDVPPRLTLSLYDDLDAFMQYDY